MKTLVAALITVLLVFALATVWMDVVQPRLDSMTGPSSHSSKQSVASLSRRASSGSVINETDEEEDEPSRSTTVTRVKNSLRGKSGKPSAEQERLRKQFENLKIEEAKLVDRQNTMKLLYEDIFHELAQVDDIRRRSAAELASAEQKVLNITLNKPTVTTRNEAGNAAARKSRAEARIANVVQDLMDRGSTPAAAALLSGLKDMEVAKILSLLTDRDPKLALQLSNQVQAARQNSRRF